jgi:hypothetical protein
MLQQPDLLNGGVLDWRQARRRSDEAGKPLLSGKNGREALSETAAFPAYLVGIGHAAAS